ncbi:ankyrin and HET domain-containing protein [Cercophora newfieldiana]|uniref:Ankyrin and HET domain-containing protein n=1 Tax=Cercophora newfieldiana TaxID=92897 RepID=A0AA40CRG9_9PEZI|nr:ankyrin and HET domain-containing protein [Cercophora newfieldiana]
MEQPSETRQNQTSPYGGEPLGTTQIRILHLDPAADDLRLTGTLETVALQQEPVYEALSYEWGSPDKLCELTTADGSVIHITESLHQALLDLRHRNREDGRRTLWADGICINQEDMLERECQVSIMGRVYRQATRVIAYIGPAKDDSAAAIEIACKLWRLHNDPKAPALDDLEAADLADVGLPPLSHPGWAGLKPLCLRTWASRCWCAQEFVCNENLSVMCGQSILPSWSVLPVFIRLCFLRQLPAVLSPSTVEDTGSLRDCLSSLLVLRTVLLRRASWVDINLWYLLTRFHPFRASDPRDKIYSVLGHDEDKTHLDISVDYTISAERLYTIVAARIIKKHGDPKFLISNLHQKTLSLPSWVPDWSTWHFGSGAGGVAFERTHLAAGTTSSRMVVDENSGRLEVSGCLVDEVDWVGERILPHYVTHDGDIAARRQIWIEQQLEIVRKLEPYPDGSSDGTSVLFRTLVANTTHQDTPANETYVRYFEAHMNVTDDTPEEQKEMARKFCDAVRSRSRWRSLSSTRRRYFGALPQTTRVGDLVCMFHGARHLFVLRPKGPDYTYVGHAYVHGLMRGEILKADWYHERTFVLV